MSFLNLTSSKTKNSGSGPKYALSPTPLSFKYFSAFFAVLLGSLSYGSFLTASNMSQKMFSVGCELKGSIIGLDRSGFKIISDSFIAFQPAIDDPSKNTPFSNISSSTTLTSMVKCWSLPLGSVNLRSTYSISFSFIVFLMLDAVINVFF